MSSTVSAKPGWRSLTRRILAAAALAAMCVAGYALFPSAQQASRLAVEPAVPVVVAAAQRRDVPIALRGLGTVQANRTVAVRSRVDGHLQRLAFAEGASVKAGDVLAQIDPRPFQAALDQASAQKAQDEAKLANAQLDLARYQSLAQRDFSSKQQVDTQRALVAQFQAQINGDQAAIDNARVQLEYATIRSPIDGRVGLRLIDEGNVIHASDPTGLVVVTQVQPIAIVFTLPEDQLDAVRSAQQAGAPAVAIVSRDGRQHLADGTLHAIDNEIDQSTGTIRLKALAANEDGALSPGQFVAARLLLRTERQAIIIPAAAVQRGAQGLYAYVVTADGHAELRWLKVGQLDQDLAVIEDGIRDGESVVTGGQSRLQPGARVDPHPAA